MVELLTLQGKCSPLRSKSAHSSGHLPVFSKRQSKSRPLDAPNNLYSQICIK